MGGTNELSHDASELGGGTSDGGVYPSRHAREKEAVLLAQAAYRDFHVECFWSFGKDVDITITKVDWVVERLLRHGRGNAWKVAEKIQALLSA